MDLKTELEEYLRKNTDKSNCRWLCKRNPDLWDTIKKATCFLDESALPKQRCWHVINDMYERPVCPTTGEYTLWFENRYLTYISQSAKASDPHFQSRCRETYENKTGHSGHWSSNLELIERKRETFYSNIDQHKKQDFAVTRAKDSAWYKGVQAAWDDEEKKKLFGQQMVQKWQNFDPEFKKEFLERSKAWWTTERRYEQSLRSRKPFTVARAYYVEVMFWTRLHWREKQELINPDNLERGYWENHIDHIYSIRDGFVNNVPAEIVGHWTNLRLISRTANQRKNSKSERTLEEAVDIYMQSQNDSLY